MVIVYVSLGIEGLNNKRREIEDSSDCAEGSYAKK